jgi:hypothetical protein
MPDVQDLWALADALKTSLPFAVALPILVATVFANIVDWLEGYLTRQQSPQEQAESAWASEREITIEPAPRRAWFVFGGDVRNRKSA